MDIIAASVNPPPPSGAAGSSQSSAVLLTAKLTRSVKREIRVVTLLTLLFQRRHSADLIWRRLVIKHGQIRTVKTFGRASAGRHCPAIWGPSPHERIVTEKVNMKKPGVKLRKTIASIHFVPCSSNAAIVRSTRSRRPQPSRPQVRSLQCGCTSRSSCWGPCVAAPAGRPRSRRSDRGTPRRHGAPRAV